MLSIEELKELFEYKDGNLYWKIKKYRRPINKPAGWINDDGYRNVTIYKKIYKVHRIVFAIHDDKWPDNEVDHINGNRSDNRIENLRSVTRHQNCYNKKSQITKENKLLIPGVYYRKDTDKYRIQLYVNGIKKHFGQYDTIDEANTKCLELREKYYSHNNSERYR